MSDLPSEPQIEPLVSVIMPCYKMGRYIGEALESVGKQTYTNWEVIAVDDCGPEDGTQEIIERFARQFPKNRVAFHRHEINQGVSAARNSAIALSQGEYLAFLDPDDLWESQHLKQSSEILNKNINFGVVCSPSIAFSNFDSIRIPWIFTDWQRNNFRYAIACNCFFQPSGVLARKSIIVNAGGFSTEQDLQHIEDYELWIRLVKKGEEFFLLEKPSCLYRRHEMSATSNINAMYKLHENLMKKHSDFFISMHGFNLWLMQKEIQTLKEYYNKPINKLLRKIESLLLYRQ
jgi:glycosyltransferase involved in cell wall biosynthesis